MVQGLDYYEVLGLTRAADDVTLRRAFRKLALKLHPEISKDEADTAEFNRVCEAYDVLSDAKRKGTYDLHGEGGLKNGLPDGSGGMTGGTYHFDSELTPAAVFARFFGTDNPYEALDAISAQFEALMTVEKPKVGRNKVYPVELTLEEIFHGCLKKVHHKRKVLLEDGTYLEEPRDLTIDVKPGLPNGTRFVFAGEGNKTPKKDPGPVIFVLKALPHASYTRKGDDLEHRVTLPLYQALCGTHVSVPTLDHRTLKVPIADIVKPGFKTVVAGEGMPKAGAGGARGDLTVVAELLFPKGLTEQQKMLVKAGVFLPEQPLPAQAKALVDFERAFTHPLDGWANAIPKDEPTLR